MVAAAPYLLPFLSPHRRLWHHCPCARCLVWGTARSRSWQAWGWQLQGSCGPIAVHSSPLNLGSGWVSAGVVGGGGGDTLRRLHPSCHPRPHPPTHTHTQTPKFALTNGRHVPPPLPLQARCCMACAVDWMPVQSSPVVHPSPLLWKIVSGAVPAGTRRRRCCG